MERGIETHRAEGVADIQSDVLARHLGEAAGKQMLRCVHRPGVVMQAHLCAGCTILIRRDSSAEDAM